MLFSMISTTRATPLAITGNPEAILRTARNLA